MPWAKTGWLTIGSSSTTTTLTTVSGTLAVAAASIGTRNTRRGTHLRSAGFFDSGNHPHITFHAEGTGPRARVPR